MTPTEKIHDLVIIGGGPTGLFGLFYACLRDMDTVLIDSLAEPGGQLAALYPDKDIYDMPGFPRVKARDLVASMVEQATMHRPQTIYLGERVETLEQDPANLVLTLHTSAGRVIRTRSVVITTGAGAFRPNKLAVPGIEALEEKQVFYFVKNADMFHGKRVAIVGGGDSALDWVLNLHERASEVMLIHRRDVFRAHEDTVSKVQALDHVKQYLHCEVKDFAVGAMGDLEQVAVENSKTGDRLLLHVDAVIVNLGFAADMGPVKNWGVELSGNYIKTDWRMMTNLTGVYAAGDVATYPGKLKLIATGTSEAAIAVNAAKHYIDPAQREQPVHSTSLFEKKSH